jgi:CheY-like chemotaxis protein
MMGNTKPKQLLLIDDDSIIPILFEAALSEIKTPVHYTYMDNGTKALSYLKSHIQDLDTFPDIILIDLNMPLMDGFEFIEQYEQDFFQLFPQTQNIVLTSSVSERDRSRALQYKSVKGFISKPLKAEKLASLL